MNNVIKIVIYIYIYIAVYKKDQSDDPCIAEVSNLFGFSNQIKA